MKKVWSHPFSRSVLAVGVLLAALACAPAQQPLIPGVQQPFAPFPGQPFPGQPLPGQPLPLPITPQPIFPVPGPGPDYFSSQCFSRGGTVINIAGVNTCREVIDVTDWGVALNPFANVPMVYVTPSNWSLAQSVSSSVLPSLRRLDRVRIKSQGTYGYHCVFECSGGNYYTMDGTLESSGELRFNQSLPAGLMLVVGSHVYQAGNGAENEIQMDGAPRLGINFFMGPSNVGTTATRVPKVSGYRITRCTDAQNNPHRCP